MHSIISNLYNIRLVSVNSVPISVLLVVAPDAPAVPAFPDSSSAFIVSSSAFSASAFSASSFILYSSSASSVLLRCFSFAFSFSSFFLVFFAKSQQQQVNLVRVDHPLHPLYPMHLDLLVFVSLLHL